MTSTCGTAKGVDMKKSGMLWEYVCSGLGSNFHIPIYIDLGEVVKEVTVFSSFEEVSKLFSSRYEYVYLYFFYYAVSHLLSLN